MSTAHQLARALGAKRSGRQWVCCCPAHDDAEPSLIFWQGHSAIRFKCYSGCEPKDVIAALRRRGLLDDREQRERDHGVTESRKPPPRKTDDEYERDQQRKASWLWLNARPIAGTIAESYLRARGINCVLPATLGFLPARNAERHPAMIAAFGLPEELEPGVLGEPPHTKVNSVHLTLL